MFRIAFCLGLLLTLPAHAAEVAICFNYGCQSEAKISFAEPLIEQLVTHVQEADNAQEERLRLAEVVGQLYREAGRQSPIKADRKGDYLDEGVTARWTASTIRSPPPACWPCWRLMARCASTA